MIDLLRKPYAGIYTVGQMQPRQLSGIGGRKLRELVLPRLPVSFDWWYERQIPDDPSTRLEPVRENTATLRDALGDRTREQSRARAREAADGSVTFLNRTFNVTDGNGVRWDDDRFEELPLLWALKLYAFEPLTWAVEGFASGSEVPSLRSTFDDWLRDWIESVEIGRPGYLRGTWTPWAVSLRILRWSRYLAWRQAGEPPAAFRRALYRNALFLHNHVEWDVGGNHLIENGAALLVAGLVFEEASWITAGENILAETAETQFLDDGCHFERSPMYHILTLTRYLTACDLTERSGRPVPVPLRTTAEAGTAFLEYLEPPDGSMPLLNDSVHGQGLALADCLRYASALGFRGEDSQQAAHVKTDPRLSSGYHWLRTDAGSLLVDGGAVGPPHLPGHSHSDTLSVLLWLGEQPVVTDTGTFRYADDSHRLYARGVRGHNTVQVGDTEPIALGGKYLMGPRPDPTTRAVDGTVSLFEGRYDAAPFRGPSYSHHRAVYAGSHWWLVRDTVSGHEGERVRSRLHLHPETDASMQPGGEIELAFGESQTAVVHPVDGTRASITAGWYFPQFGVADSRDVLECHAERSGADPVTLGYLITDEDPDSVAVETGAASRGLEKLRLNGHECRLPGTELTNREVT